LLGSLTTGATFGPELLRLLLAVQVRPWPSSFGGLSPLTVGALPSVAKLLAVQI